MGLNKFSALTLTFIIAHATGSHIVAEPLDISAAQDLAVLASDDLRAFAAQLQAQSLALDLALRGYFPKITLSYSDSRQVKVRAPDTDSVQMGLTLSQPLFDGGRSSAQRRLASAQLRVKSEEYAVAVEQTRDEAWLLFRQIQLERERLGIQAELSLVAADQLRIAETERRLGSLLEVDYLGVRSEVQSLELQSLKTRASLQDLEWKMRRLLGIDPLVALELQGRLDRDYTGLSLPSDDRDGEFAAIALKRNPSLRSARAAALQSTVQHELSKISFIPTLGLECAASLSGQDFPLQNPSFSAKLVIQFPHRASPTTVSGSASSTGPSGYGRSGSVSVSPLDDLGFLSDERIAQVQAAAKRRAVTKAERELSFSVAQQLGALDLKRRALALSREALDTQGKKLSLMEKQVELGELKRVEFMKSQVAFYNQRITLYESVQELTLAERAFEKALGLPAGELSTLAAGEKRP